MLINTHLIYIEYEIRVFYYSYIHTYVCCVTIHSITKFALFLSYTRKSGISLNFIVMSSTKFRLWYLYVVVNWYLHINLATVTFKESKAYLQPETNQIYARNYLNWEEKRFDCNKNLPMQFRIPFVNGMKAYGCFPSKFEGKKLSGLKICASSPQMSFRR